MTDYVAEMTQRLLMPNTPVSPPFRKFVSGLLSSTRLPSTTILLGLNYLSKRINISMGAGHLKTADAGQTWRWLTIGLVLGSKFLDDNTFQNRSWSEVSGISVAELNRLEYEWLVAIEWDMYVNLDVDDSYNAWLANWDKWRRDNNKERNATLERLAPLPPINTNVQHFQRDSIYSNAYSGYTKSSAREPLSGYNAPSYEQPWNTLPTPQLTPPSAPDSGLNTPEYLSATGGGPRYDWTVFNPYPRGYQQQPQAPYVAPRIASYHHTPFSNNYGHYNPNVWDSAVAECGCSMCVPPPKQPYFMSHYGGQQLVAG